MTAKPQQNQFFVARTDINGAAEASSFRISSPFFSRRFYFSRRLEADATGNHGEISQA